MKDLIEKVFEEKMKDGSFEKIISAKIEEMISSLLREMMSWDGCVKKSFEEKLKPIMLQAVSKCDLTETAAIVTEILNNSVKQTPVHLMERSFNGLKSLFSQNETVQNIKFGQKVKLSDIFKEYCELIQKGAPYDQDDLEERGVDVLYDDGRYACVTAEMSVERKYRETYYGSRREEYEIMVHSSLNKEDEELLFKIAESYDKTLRIEYDTGHIVLAELGGLDPFVMYLIILKSNYCNIEIDTSEELKELYVEVNCL